MCQITKLIFILLIGASYASYFNPIVKTIQLSTEYGVPQEYTPVKPFEEYGVPLIRTPTLVYGAPTSTVPKVFINSVPKVLVPPATTYGVPVQRVEVPKSKIFEYSVQSVPTLKTLEFKTEPEEVVVPSEVYGVPVVKSVPQVPAIEYGVPISKTASFVAYEAPRATFEVPHVVYEVPKEPSQEYGLPQVRIPATVYGLP